MQQPASNTPGDVLVNNSPALLKFICGSLATSVEVFIHRDIGERYLGTQAAAVLVIVPLFGLGWEGYDLRLLFWFLPAYLVMCLIARIGMLKRRWRGEQGHSYYTGWPRGFSGRGKVSELTMKRFLEPLAILTIGGFVCALDPPLGTYLMFAAGGLFISVNLSAEEDRTRVLDMHDAVIHQELIAERFRDLRRDQF
ncbi:MAG: hypothetical protein JNM18_13145 [Planctomycetaceae bacterium]|nr:hypothetical protein [Planctomycetaceae bacterium]